jgi:hypothetical protein
MFFAIAAAIIFGACNLPAAVAPANQAGDGATNPGEQNEGAQPDTVETPTTTPTFSPTGTGLPTSTATITPTLTLTVPMISVSVDTNCRTGPGNVYDLLGFLKVGEAAEIIGWEGVGNFYVIKEPRGSKECWLWANYATVSGSTAGLKVYAIPPTPTPTATATPALPAGPSNLSAQTICTPGGSPNFYDLTGTLTWKDNANNEDGFNIYVIQTYITNAAVLFVDNVGPNVTSYNFSVGSLHKGPPTLIVEAYNSAGKSKSVSTELVFTCP